MRRYTLNISDREFVVDVQEIDAPGAPLEPQQVISAVLPLKACHAHPQASRFAITRASSRSAARGSLRNSRNILNPL